MDTGSTDVAVTTTDVENAKELLSLVVPNAENLQVAAEVVALVNRSVEALLDNLTTVLAECDEAAPFTVAHTDYLCHRIQDARIRWLVGWSLKA